MVLAVQIVSKKKLLSEPVIGNVTHTTQPHTTHSSPSLEAKGSCVCCGCVLWLCCVLCAVLSNGRVVVRGAWCDTLKKNRVWIQKRLRVYIQNVSCVPAKRPRAQIKWAFCQYTRRRFECTHGSILKSTQGCVGSRGGRKRKRKKNKKKTEFSRALEVKLHVKSYQHYYQNNDARI